MTIETKTVAAKAEFVRFVEGYGMVVSNGAGKKVKVPVTALQAFADEGLIAAPKGGKKAEADEDADADNDGGEDEAPAA